MSRQTLEVEFKWRVRNAKDFETFLKCARLLPIKLIKSYRAQIVDSYVDSSKNTFSKIGVKARIRKIGSSVEVTFKGMSESQGGLVKRLERNIKIRSDQKQPQIIIQDFLNKLGETEPRITTLFQVKNKRTIFAARSGALRAEMCFDSAIIQKGGRKIKLLEIELEQKSGRFKDFQGLVSRLTQMSKLKPARISKVATAYKHFRFPYFRGAKMTAYEKRLIFG